MDITIKRTNKIVLTTNWILDTFLLLGYISEYIKGGRPLEYVLTFLLLLLVPMVSAQVIYKNKNDSAAIKYITIVGFFILYSFALFTTTRVLVFVYIIPIILNYHFVFQPPLHNSIRYNRRSSKPSASSANVILFTASMTDQRQRTTPFRWPVSSWLLSLFM